MLNRNIKKYEIKLITPAHKKMKSYVNYGKEK